MVDLLLAEQSRRRAVSGPLYTWWGVGLVGRQMDGQAGCGSSPSIRLGRCLGGHRLMLEKLSETSLRRRLWRVRAGIKKNYIQDMAKGMRCECECGRGVCKGIFKLGFLGWDLDSPYTMDSQDRDWNATRSVGTCDAMRCETATRGGALKHQHPRSSSPSQARLASI